MRGLVAVVEDDPVLRRNLARGLAAEGFEVVWSAADGKSAMSHAAGSPRPDAVVLDLGLPDTDGVDLLGALRAGHVDAPVLVLTARSSLNDRLNSFGSGADDFLGKPFELAELAARLDVLIRRHRPAPGFGAVTLDPVTHSLSTASGSVVVSPIEYRLIAALSARRGEVVRRATLLSAGWPPGAIVRENTLDAFIGRVRRALRAVHAEVTIETVRGVGYRLG